MIVDGAKVIGRVAAISMIAVAAVLVVVFVGYPDWMWFPLTAIFWLALVALIASAGLYAWKRVKGPG